jgi:hypothetical protein
MHHKPLHDLKLGEDLETCRVLLFSILTRSGKTSNNPFHTIVLMNEIAHRLKITRSLRSFPNGSVKVRESAVALACFSLICFIDELTPQRPEKRNTSSLKNLLSAMIRVPCYT